MDIGRKEEIKSLSTITHTPFFCERIITLDYSHISCWASWKKSQHVSLTLGLAI